MEEHCTDEHCSTHLPTQQQLRDSGANTLAASVGSLGGLAAFSERMGLPLNARHPNGYWDDFEHLAQELAPFLAPSPNGRRVFPKQQQLVAAGRAYLVPAIKLHGG